MIKATQHDKVDEGVALIINYARNTDAEGMKQLIKAAENYFQKQSHRFEVVR